MINSWHFFDKLRDCIKETVRGRYFKRELLVLQLLVNQLNYRQIDTKYREVYQVTKPQRFLG